MNPARTLRKIVAFFLAILPLPADIVERCFWKRSKRCLASLRSTTCRASWRAQLSSALPAGSNYFAFALVGFAFFDYLSVSFTAFDSSIEEARQNRTLEALLVTQTPLPVILAGSAVYPFTALALRIASILHGARCFLVSRRAPKLARSSRNSPGVRSCLCWTRNNIGWLFGSL